MRYMKSMAFTSGLFALVASLLLAAASTNAAPITAGQLVNVRGGDGTLGLGTGNGVGRPVTLDVYDVTYTGFAPTNITLSQSIPLPIGADGTAPSSGNRYLAQSGNAALEGGLALSGNGLYMTLAGYNSGIGGPTNPGSTGTEDRIVGRLDLSTGTVDTTTALQNFAGSTNGQAASRGAYTTNGTDIWVALSVGVRYATFGTNNASTGVILGTANNNNNARRVVVFNGQLYQSEAANSRFGIEQVGTGTPTTAGSATFTLLPGFPASGLSTNDFWFADANTLYLADDRNTTTGGLQKWVFDSDAGTWSMAYNLHVNIATSGTTNRGLRSLTGFMNEYGRVVLFGATTDQTPNFLYGFSDTLSNTNAANVTVNKLVDASTAFSGGSLWNLRGVALAPGVNIPEPGSLVLLAMGSLLMLAGRRRKA